MCFRVVFFSIYINDIQAACPELLSFLFADDNSTFLSARNTEELIEKANLEINSLKDWYISNRLSIHPLKSRAMIFYPPTRPPNLNGVDGNYYLPLYIDNNDPNAPAYDFDPDLSQRIELIPNMNEKSFKVLGIYLDHNLNMKEHVKKLRTKIARANFSINQMKHFLDKKHLKLLVNAYVKSHIEYNCNLLSLCNKTTLKPLNMQFKKTIRSLCNAKYRAHTTPLFKKERILPIEQQIQFHALKFMHSYVYEYCPKAFNDTWKFNRHNNNYNTRAKDDFYIERTSMAYFDNHPLFKFPKLWNAMDSYLKTIPDKNEFLRSLKSNLLNNIEN